MTVRAWVYIYSIFSTALLISLVAAFSFWGLKEPNWVAFGTLTALAVASQIYEAEGTFRNTYYLHYVFFSGCRVIS